MTQKPQILHLADWCNECGNCNTFCPSSGAPYKEKPHLYLNYNAFEKEKEGFYFDANEKNIIKYKTDDVLYTLTKNEVFYDFKFGKNSLKLNIDTMEIISSDLIDINEEELDLKNAALMSLVLQGAKQL